MDLREATLDAVCRRARACKLNCAEFLLTMFALHVGVSVSLRDELLFYTRTAWDTVRRTHPFSMPADIEDA